MYNGKHLPPKRKRRKKLNMFFVALVLLFLGAAGGTMAFLLDTTSRVENTFTPAEVKISINETVENNTKSGISFTNSNDPKSVPVYVRATLVIYWKDTIDGAEELVPAPAGASVSVPAEMGQDWIKVGDIYYYTVPVAPPDGTTTAMLMNAVTVTIPEGSTAKCYIDVRAEAIQAEPADAVKAAWPVEVGSDGRLSAKTSGGA